MGRIPGEQIAGGAALVLAGFFPFFDRPQAQPEQVARAGGGHVEQAQVFAQALFFGLGQVVVADLQHQAAIGAAHKGGAGPFFLRKVAGKGQHHQRVFQALAFVDGDDLHQVGIAFQAHGLRLGIAVGVGDGFLQPADERLLALHGGAGLLQQLAQVQHIGQPPLAVRLGQPAGGQAQLVQAGAQHGQHALALPKLVQAVQLGGALVQQGIVVRQLLQIGKRQIQQAGGKGGPQGAGVQWLGHGPQPKQQVVRLGAGKDGFAVGQIHRGNAALAQRLAHGAGLFALAHQNRYIARAQAHKAAIGLGKAHAGVVQPLGQLLGAGGGKQGAQVLAADGLGRDVPGHVQGGHGGAVGVQHFGAALGRDLNKRQGVVRAVGAKAKRTAARPVFGLGKPVVHGSDQGMAGAVVFIEHIVPPGGGLPRLQVAVNIGPAKAVDGLLGVTNQ